MAGNWRCQTRQRARACAAGCRQRFESRDNTRFRRACRNYLQLRLRLQLVQIRCAYDWTIAQWITLSPRQCRTHLVMVPQTTPAAGLGRPHDVRKGVIRRHGGRLSRCSIQRVRMGLRATDGTGGCCRLPDTSSPATKTARGIPRTSHCMFMTGQLLDREGRGPDSAGQAAE